MGAVPCGSEVNITLHVESDVLSLVHDTELELFEPEESKQIPMQRFEKGFTVTLILDGSPRVVFYRFKAHTEIGDLIYSARVDGRSTSGSAYLFSPDDIENPMASDAQEGPFPIQMQAADRGFQITVYDPGFSVPRWFGESGMYQIFPDRFARGEAGIRSQGVLSHRDRGWNVSLHEDWNEPPYWGDPYEPMDFFGGTLKGISEKLDYLESLNIKTIYLNPIWEARSNHRYDTGDYETIDPILGDWDDFKQLCRMAEDKGIKVILDTVLSHTGTSSKYFNLDGSYDSIGAIQGDASPYYCWYEFRDTDGGLKYRCWWNDPTLPEVNEGDQSWQRYILGIEHDAEGIGIGDCVIRKWLENGTSGLRLDVADEIPDDVLDLLRMSVKDADEDTVVIGEVWEDPTTKESYGVKRRYALGSSLDSVMNYPLRANLIRFANGSIDAIELSTFLKSQRLNYPKPMYHAMMNLLSSHDVERIRSVLSLGYEFREYERDDQLDLVNGIEAYADERGARLQTMLAMILYSVPGVPCIYYGDERGMHGGRDPFDRATFPWNAERGDCGIDVTEQYRQLGYIRRYVRALNGGEAAFYTYGKDVICVLRILPESDDAILCIANRSERPHRIAIDLFEDDSGLSKRAKEYLRYRCEGFRCISTSDIFFPMAASIDCAYEDGIVVIDVEPMHSYAFHGKAKSDVIYSIEGLDSFRLGKTMEPGLGVICHVTSLPGDSAEGGTFGDSMLRFIDALSENGYKYWEILPITPTDEYGSPYAGISAFAGNLDLLDSSDIQFDASDQDEYAAFLDRNGKHLRPFAAFRAIKRSVGEIPWYDWPDEYRDYSDELLDLPELQEEMEQELRRQYLFDRQWRKIKGYANANGVKMIGDMPIYVSVDSADVWANREYFMVDSDGTILEEGGTPPDRFSADGQLWGNPTYRWDALADTGYDWWLDRFERMMDWFDYTRIDHFIGFANYYAIEVGRSASEGVWREAPGSELFRVAFDRFGPLPFIAEDLGVVSDDVKKLLYETGFPGMDVIQFSDEDPRNGWVSEPNKVKFTSTHDTSTLLGWVLDAIDADRERAKDISSRSLKDAFHVVLGKASGELSDLDEVIARRRNGNGVLIVSIQDILCLDDGSRMNVPGSIGGNWSWRISDDDFARLSTALSEA